jgi:hypothetical protein|tara:strand:- start:1895 stop:2014 length:120 start_codon:yes stop_codon:yes gene_type:complete
MKDFWITAALSLAVFAGCIILAGFPWLAHKLMQIIGAAL